MTDFIPPRDMAYYIKPPRKWVGWRWPTLVVAALLVVWLGASWRESWFPFEATGSVQQTQQAQQTQKTQPSALNLDALTAHNSTTSNATSTRLSESDIKALTAPVATTSSAKAKSTAGMTVDNPSPLSAEDLKTLSVPAK